MKFLQAAEAIIRMSVEPLLEEYRPPGITSLKFSKLSLGSVAPKIEGNKQLNDPKIILFHFQSFFWLRLCCSLLLNSYHNDAVVG